MFKKLTEIVAICEEKNITFPDVIIEEEMNEEGLDYATVFHKMEYMYDCMKEADDFYDPNLKSKSGLAGGDGKKLEDFSKKENRLLGDFLTLTMEKAVKMAESNACMKRIVAAPTAGSCGVIPSVLLTYAKKKDISKEKLVLALFVAGGVGEVIANSASISGAEGGCQAEIGSAAAMAGAALTYLEGGDNKAILNTVALALKNMLGLTCDPVAGLVEVPCVKRNVFGAINAVTASEMVKAGIESKISADEVIDSMRRIGNQLPTCLKETSLDGLATTKDGIAIKEKIEKNFKL